MYCNIVNLVVYIDFNCMLVIEFFVVVFKVKYIIVCGYYGCGGVKVVLENISYGFIDNWLYSIKNLYYCNKYWFELLVLEEDCYNYLCELNVK